MTQWPFSRSWGKKKGLILYIPFLLGLQANWVYKKKQFWNCTPNRARGISSQNTSNIAIWHRKEVIFPPPEAFFPIFFEIPPKSFQYSFCLCSNVVEYTRKNYKSIHLYKHKIWTHSKILKIFKLVNKTGFFFGWVLVRIWCIYIVRHTPSRPFFMSIYTAQIIFFKKN